MRTYARQFRSAAATFTRRGADLRSAASRSGGAIKIRTIDLSTRSGRHKHLNARTEICGVRRVTRDTPRWMAELDCN